MARKWQSRDFSRSGSSVRRLHQWLSQHWIQGSEEEGPLREKKEKRWALRLSCFLPWETFLPRLQCRDGDLPSKLTEMRRESWGFEDINMTGLCRTEQHRRGTQTPAEGPPRAFSSVGIRARVWGNCPKLEGKKSHLKGLVNRVHFQWPD